MKTKLRLYFALAVVFILYVSFKILEPIVEANQGDELLHVKRDFVDMKPEVFRPLKTPVPLNVTSVRESQMLKAYSVDWNLVLKDSPWAIAGRWVTQRHVIPDVAAELGKFRHTYAAHFLSNGMVIVK